MEATRVGQGDGVGAAVGIGLRGARRFVPSPKFQERLVMLSVEVSVKVTVKGG